MKTDEYIVINKTKLEERLEVLEIVEAQQVGNLNEHIARGERKALENILSSKSTQLTPLLQNAFDESRRQHSWAGGNLYGDGYNEEQDLTDFKYSTSQDYINNLKLDI